MFILNIKLYEDKIDTFINNKVYNLIDRKVINKVIRIRGVEVIVETCSDNTRVFKQIVKTDCVKSLVVLSDYGDEEYNDETGLPLRDVTNEDVSGGRLFVEFGSELLSINDAIILDNYNLNDSFNRSTENKIYEPPFITDGNLVNPGYHTIIQSLPNPNINIPNYISKSLADPLINQPSIFGGTLPPNPWLATIYGCTDPSFISYNPDATQDDGTCNNNVYGCSDPSMKNYNPEVNIDDGTCIDYIRGCVDPTATNYNSIAEADDGSCEYPPILGCTDSLFEEFDQNATQDDGSCTTPRELLTQVIPIQHTWNFFSTFINLNDAPYNNYSPGDFFANHVYYTSDPSQATEQNRVQFNVATIIRDTRGAFWTPLYTQIDRLDNSQGYRVYTELPSDVSEVYMILTGRPITSNVPSPDTTLNIPSVVTTVELGIDWNLMPVPAYESIDIDDWVDFNMSIDPTFRTSVKSIKDVRGNFWLSTPGPRSLERLEPGNAYLAYMNSPATARFEIPAVYGCTDPSATNYKDTHKVEDSTCVYASEITTHEITLPGRDDMGWSQDSFFPNYQISTYIDVDIKDNNSIRHIIENSLYDEYGVKVPIENIPRYIYRVRNFDAKVFLPVIGRSDPYDSDLTYNPGGDFNWTNGDVLIIETSGQQNEAFSLRLEGTPITTYNEEVRGDKFSSTANAIGIIATASVNVPEYFADSPDFFTNVSEIKDQVTGHFYRPGLSPDNALTLQPGKGYVVTLNSRTSAFNHIRQIEFNAITADTITQYIPQIIDIPYGETWISSYIKMVHPTQAATPYSIHEVIYNNINIGYGDNFYNKATLSTISSSIEYVAIPSFSESFDKWPTSSFATPNTDLKWDHTDGRGYLIKNNNQSNDLKLILNNPIIQTEKLIDGDAYNFSDTRFNGNPNQMLIGAYCLEPTLIENYFEPGVIKAPEYNEDGALTSRGIIHHISSSDNTFWTASGPEAPGTLQYIEPGKAYKATAHDEHHDTLTPSIHYGTLPLIVANPDPVAQSLTTDEIEIISIADQLNNVNALGNTANRHVIEVKQGWNMISTYIDTSKFSQPSQSLSITDTSIWANNVFDSDGDKLPYESLNNILIIMKNNLGQAAIFEYGFSGLGNWQPNQGYQLKAHTDCRIIFEGEPSEPVWELTSGWNMVFWPHWKSQDLFQAIPVEYLQYIIIAKSNDGKAYIPEYDFNGIGEFLPGQGYQLKTTQAINIPLNVKS